MNLIQTSDYRIYIDNVRVDPYIIDWNSRLGLFASDATAAITLYRSPALDKIKPYLAQVKIFARNIFTKKFAMVFDGEIINRSHSSSRANVGTVTFAVRGYYHWLNISVPLMINTYDEFVNAKRFMYEAQNINTENILKNFITQKDMLFKEKTIPQIIDLLLEQIHTGYFDLGKNETAFDFVDLKNRFKVLGEMNETFRQAGFLDTVTFVTASQIDSFYVYLNEMLSQMMFEFFQDRDGTFKIKPPSWSENILKNHVLDEFLVQNVSGMSNWDSEPTRVLAKGGTSELLQATTVPGSPGASQFLGDIPMGLYIGTPEKGEFFSQRIQRFMKDYGMAPPSGVNDGSNFVGGVAGGWFDNLDQYPITQKHRTAQTSNPRHRGVDYGFRYQPILSIGTHGKVTLANMGSATAGNWIIVEQELNGKRHQFVYMHMSKFSVKAGDNVTPGQELGISGNTGDSSGPHLHFEIWEGDRHNGGKDLNPVEFLKKMKDSGAGQQKPSGGSGGSSGSPLKEQPKDSKKDDPFGLKGGNNNNSMVINPMDKLGVKKAMSLSPRVATPAINFVPDLNNPIKIPSVLDQLNEMQKKVEPKPVKYDPKRELKYKVPQKGNFYTMSLSQNPHGVEGNLLCCIISYQSNWNMLFDNKTHIGLMGVNKEHFGKDMMKEDDKKFGFTSIDKGSEFFSKCMERFKGKVTFSLLAYYRGEMGTVQDLASKTEGGLNFKNARKSLEGSDAGKKELKFVDGVIKEYTELLGGNYVEGDPNKNFDPTNPNQNESIMFPGSALNTSLPDFESNYRAMLSDEEKKYKMNLKIVEQQLIKNDLNGVEAKSLDKVLEDYAKYIMYISRAQAHNIQVTLNACLPNLRPGYNAWLEPTRQDIVFYITGITHHGSYGNGCSSSVSGGYIREPGKYDEIDASVFVGTPNATAKDFGAVIEKDKMAGLRNRLKELHANSENAVADASEIELLRELYTIPDDKVGNYATIWNKEFTEDELNKQIQSVYSKAPKLIKERAKEIEQAISDSEEFFVKHLLMQKF